jgi:hypothetical protein
MGEHETGLERETTMTAIDRTKTTEFEDRGSKALPSAG